MTADYRCPVGQARFRGARICSRCGADLGPLMLLAAKAWQLREQARQSLEKGDNRAALDMASQAQELCRTRNGERLLVVGSWLSRKRGGRQINQQPTNNQQLTFAFYGAELNVPGDAGT